MSWNDDTHIWALAERQRFVRARAFAAGENGDRWWFPSEEREPIANGREFVEVVELVPTKTAGKVALYRQWIVDPDGVEVDVPWVSKRSKLHMRAEPVLRGTLNRCGYREVAAERIAKAEKPRAAPPQPVGDDAGTLH
jgi:hypothetical protein